MPSSETETTRRRRRRQQQRIEELESIVARQADELHHLLSHLRVCFRAVPQRLRRKLLRDLQHMQRVSGRAIPKRL